MITLKIFRILAVLYIISNLFMACSKVESKDKTSPEIVLVASTPGDSLIKSLLAINPETKIDFIRWDLRLFKEEQSSNTFIMNLEYGESLQNTMGFKNGAKKLLIKGKYTILKNQSKYLTGDIYQLKSVDNQVSISMIKLNENLFHLISPDHQLLSGNGGWSYTLNRKTPLNNNSEALPSLTISKPLFHDSDNQVTFDGRTPCLELAKQYNLQVNDNCFKLKWRLTLYKDPNTLMSGTFTMRSVGNQATDIEGKWRIIKACGNPSVSIYQLDRSISEPFLSFLAGDENVMFFLDRNYQLFTGNKDFSFTLNKRIP